MTSKELVFVVKFEKKPSKKGENYYFNIPIQLFRSEIINSKLEYEIQVFESNN